MAQELSDADVGLTAAPQELSDADVFGASATQSPAQALQNPNPGQAGASGSFDAPPLSGMDRFGHGLMDPVYGLGQLAAHVLPASMGRASVDQQVADREANYQAQRQSAGQSGTDWPRIGGKVVATLPLMAAAPEDAPVLGGALMGGSSSALEPITWPTDNFWTQKAKDTAIGAGTGAVTSGVLSWLGKPGDELASSSSDKYRDAVNFLRDRNVSPTIGQTVGPNAATAEDAFSNWNLAIPGGQKQALNGFNNAALNEALKPLNMTYTGEPGREGLKAVGDIFDKAYGAIKGQISLPVPDSLRVNIGDIISDAATPDPAIATTVQRILDKALYSQVDQSNTLTGTAFKNAQEMLGTYAKQYAGDGANATERQVGLALKNVQGALQDALEDANPQVADKLKAINRGYAILARVQDAVPTGNPDGIFTPAQLARAVAKGDNTVRGRAYAQGDALLQNLSDAGLRVLGNKFPNSGTVGRAIPADPFAWPIVAGATALGAPVYGGAGQRLMGGVLNGAANASRAVAPLMAPGLRKLATPAAIAMPAIMGQ